MRFLHSMIRVRDLDESIKFFVEILGLRISRQKENEKGRFTLVFLETGHEDDHAQIELTWNWDQREEYSGGRNFGHLAFAVDHIYDTCHRLEQAGIRILRPPRDGRMAFVRSPDEISIELLQTGEALPAQEPWISMENAGEW